MRVREIQAEMNAPNQVNKGDHQRQYDLHHKGLFRVTQQKQIQEPSTSPALYKSLPCTLKKAITKSKGNNKATHESAPCVAPNGALELLCALPRQKLRCCCAHFAPYHCYHTPSQSLYASSHHRSFHLALCKLQRPRAADGRTI